MKIAVISASSPEVYNLGARKIEAKFKQEGHEVEYENRAGLRSLQADRAYVSAIFTWDLPRLIHDVRLLKEHGVIVEIGGPAATAMHELIFEQTGIRPFLGIDPRFEFVKGDFEMVFTQRGCPRACTYCIVSTVEGRKIIEYDDFNVPVGVNPKVGDNNILCTSWRHQEIFVDKLKGVHNLDINSGFDDRIFVTDMTKYWNLYSQLQTESWRFAYDKPEQKVPLKTCVDFLHAQGVGYRDITVFCLVGFDGISFEESREKLQYLIDIGTSPYPQRFRPFDTVMRNVTPAGWKDNDLNLLFGYYGVPRKWRSATWQQYLEDLKNPQPVPPEQIKLSL